MTENTVKRAMLFDFYGDILTEKQREYYDLHYNEDLSLYEIAEHNSVSRQAVWDIIRRAEQTMLNLDEKIGLIARRQSQSEKLGELSETLLELWRQSEGEAKKLCSQAIALCEELEA